MTESFAIGLNLSEIHRKAARFDSPDATAEEKPDSVRWERRSKPDAGEPESPKGGEEDEERAAEEEEQRAEEVQAEYDRHRNAFARFRARYPDILAEYLTVSEQVQEKCAASLLTSVVDNHHSLPCNLREPELQVQSVLRDL